MPISPVPGSCAACGGDGATETLTSQSRIVTPGTPWLPAETVGTLTGIAFNVLTGTATITDQNGTVSAGIPAGTSWDWNAEDANALLGPTSVASVGGTILATWTER